MVRVDGQVISTGRKPCWSATTRTDQRHRRPGARGLDQGLLGVIGIKISNAAQAAGLLRSAQRSRNLTALTAREVIIDADQPKIPVGIDGESVMMPTPVHCTIRPLTLRVRSPAAGRRPRT